MLFWAGWLVKEYTNHLPVLKLVADMLFFSAYSIRSFESFNKFVNKKRGVARAISETNETSIDTKYLNYFYYIVNIQAVIILIFCIIIYLTIERNYELNNICWTTPYLDDIGWWIVMGIIFIAQSIGDVLISNKRQLLKSILQSFPILVWSFVFLYGLSFQYFAGQMQAKE